MNASHLAPSGLSDLANPGSLTRVLLDSMTEGVSLSREDGTIVYTNPAEDALFGYAPGELRGRHVSIQNAYPPEENARIVAEVIAELKRTGSWQGEWRNRRKDGSEFTTRSRISAVEIEGATHWLCVQEDVTEEARTARALDDERVRLRLAMEAGRMVVWDLDIVTDAVEHSPALNRALGFPEDRPLDLSAVRERYHPGEQERLSAESQAALARGETSFESSFRYRHPDGSDRWLRLRCDVLLDADGQPVRAIGVLSDETDRWRIEQELRASEEHLRNTVEFNPQVPWTCDPQGSITSYSNRWLELTGQAPGEPLGDGWAAVVHPDDLPRTLEIFAASLASGDPLDVEFRIRIAATGEFRWMRARAFPLRNGDNEIVRWYGIVEDVHDRKEAELRLRGSEARLTAVIQHAPVGIILAEAPSGRLVLGNEQVDRVWRRPFLAAAAIGEYDGYEGFHPGTGKPYTAEDWPLARSILHGEIVRGEVIAFHRGDGTRGVISASSAPIRDEAGGIVAGVVTFEDVTERRANEEALRRLNETLEAQVAERTAERDRIWRLSRDLMCVTRMDGTFLSANPAWERMLGWSPDWLKGRNPDEIRHPDDDASARAELERLAQGKPTLGYEARYRHRDGGWRWVSWTIQPGDGHLYCIGRDVTAEKATRAALEAAEAARREADALYRAYFESSAEALFVIRVEPDGGFVVEQVNPTHEAQLGFQQAEVAGRRIEDLLPPDAAAQVIQAYRRVVETGEMFQFRDSYVLSGGIQHWDNSLVPVRDSEGRISRIFGSSRNMTAQVQAEDALRQAQKMEAVGQLTGGIAHDFNNLLGALVGSLDLIRRRPDDAQRVLRLAEAGIQAAERGARLTGQLLAFSRAQRIETRPVVVADLVMGLQDLLGRTLGPMIRLSLDLACRDTVLSDPTQLEMAVLNLAINARDAMPEGGELRIGTALRTVGADAELAPGPYVELTVADSGTGMAPEVAARALDPFFTTKGVGKGTGLGLSQVYGIARQAGGTVRIDSAPGHGTTVRVLLPRTDRAPEAEAPPEREEPGPARRGATVLVVDDDPDVRAMLVASLEALGHEALVAQDGATGLALLRDATPDVLLVDFAMPGLNGAEVARAAWERRPGLPVVFVSGYSDTASIEAVAGRNALVLRKPFRVDDLQAVLLAALDARD